MPNVPEIAYSSFTNMDLARPECSHPSLVCFHFTIKMAVNRFTVASEDDIAGLIAGKASKSTKKVVQKAKQTFENFLVANGHPAAFDNFSKGEPNEHLRLSFANIKKKPEKDGVVAELNKKNTFTSLKYGVGKYIKETMGFDINEDPEFSSSIQVYEAMLKKLKQSGLGATSHYPPVSEEDFEKLYSDHRVFNFDTPVGLQCKVWFEIMFYFCRRGQENLRDMKMDTFSIKTDSSRKRFVFQATRRKISLMTPMGRAVCMNCRATQDAMLLLLRSILPSCIHSVATSGRGLRIRL
jgi:hypothetical protein